MRGLKEHSTTTHTTPWHACWFVKIYRLRVWIREDLMIQCDLNFSQFLRGYFNSFASILREFVSSKYAYYFKCSIYSLFDKYVYREQNQVELSEQIQPIQTCWCRRRAHNLFVYVRGVMMICLYVCVFIPVWICRWASRDSSVWNWAPHWSQTMAFSPAGKQETREWTLITHMYLIWKAVWNGQKKRVS